MPHITTDDGVKLYYQEVGTGIPIVFVHEFAGDCRSWEAQFRHFVGLSMGGFATLHFGFAYPDRARSLAIGGCGYGAAPDQHKKFAEEAQAAAARFEEIGMATAAESYALGPTRVQFQNKDPRGWREFADQLVGHSGKGSALTM